jgi:hypothetical protein
MLLGESGCEQAPQQRKGIRKAHANLKHKNKRDLLGISDYSAAIF